MLKEYKDVAQKGEQKRRWFSDIQLDLIVWYDLAENLSGFQLCYDIGKGEHAITWKKEGGCSHAKIDTGEDRHGPNLTPILVPNGVLDNEHILELFKQRSEKVDSEIVKIVSEVLKSLSH